MDNYLKFATFQSPEWIPVGLSILPAAWLKWGEALENIVLAHPQIFQDYRKGDFRNMKLSGLYTRGKKTDEWGCVWDSVAEGYDSICIGHPVKTREDIHTLRIPEVDAGLPHGFMFLRLTYLRGYEECMIDFAEEPPELDILIGKVLEYNIRQVRIRLASMKRKEYLISFGDDLGMQTMLPTGPLKWRNYLKPCFAGLYGLCKQAGKLVYMHSDGCIYEIIPDLRDCGVDIINPQFRANGLDNLAAACRGEGRYKIAVNLDLDRQMFPFASPAEIEEHIMLCVQALGSREGGLALSAECAADVPLNNVEAICCGLEKARAFFSKQSYGFGVEAKEKHD